MKVIIKTKFNNGEQVITCETVQVNDCDGYVSIVIDNGMDTERAFTIGINFNPAIKVEL